MLEPSPDTFGAADLGVLLEPEPFTGFAAADNRGSRLYGDFTVSAGGSAYNLLGLNERLDALVAVAPHDTSLGFLQAGIDLPLPALDGTLLDGGRLELNGDISRSDPDLASAGSPDGLTVTTGRDQPARRPLRALRAHPLAEPLRRAGLNWQESESVTAFAGSEVTSTDRLIVLYARLSWDLADRFGGVTLVDAELRQGLDIGGASVGERAGGGQPRLHPRRRSTSRGCSASAATARWSLWLEAIGQCASTVLPNSERFALGDTTIGRGFAPGNTSGDTGWGGRVELRRQLAAANLGGVAEAAELYAFGDYGRAYDRSAERDGVALGEPRLGRLRRPHRRAPLADADARRSRARPTASPPTPPTPTTRPAS